MSNHPRADLYIAERDKGLTYVEIAKKYGVSYQAVAQCCAKHTPGHFKPYTETEVVYPNLRKWLNENKVSRSEFCRRMGTVTRGGSYDAVRCWFGGMNYPTKDRIDKILAMTGLTYEELWQTEVASGERRDSHD